MGKFIYLFYILVSFFYIKESGIVFAQQKQSNFYFTSYMVKRISKLCPKKLNNASKKSKKMETYCKVNTIKNTKKDISIFESFAKDINKYYRQIRKLVFMGTVFFLIWIFTYASYKSEMKWDKLIMLIIGFIILIFIEVAIGIFTKKIVLEDVIVDGIYTDCRNPNIENTFYRCNKSEGRKYDSRYLLRISETKKTPVEYKGLF